MKKNCSQSVLFFFLLFLMMACSQVSEERRKDIRLNELLTDNLSLKEEKRHYAIIPTLHCGPCIDHALKWLASNTNDGIQSQYLFITPVTDVHKRLVLMGYESRLDSAGYIDRLNFGLYNLTVVYRSDERVDSVYRLPSKDVGQVERIFPVVNDS